MLSYRTGLRAFGLKKETSFGTDMESGDTHIAFGYDGEPIEPVSHVFYKNTGEVNMAFLPDRTELVHRKIEAQHTGKVLCNVIGLAAGCFADVYTSGAAPGETTIYKHVFQLGSSGLAANYGPGPFFSRNMIEKIGNARKLYKGVIMNGFEISAEREGFAKCSVDIIGCNGVANSSKSTANLLAVLSSQPYLKTQDITFAKGTYTFATEVFSSPTNWHAYLKDTRVKIKKTADVVFEAGSSSVWVSRVDAVGYEIEVEAKLEVNSDQAEYFTDYEAQTEYALKIGIAGPVISGAAAATKFQVNIVIPKARIEEAPISQDGDKLVRNLKFVVIASPKGVDAESEFCNIEVFDKVLNYVL